jgi:hypothetical protein
VNRVEPLAASAIPDASSRGFRRRPGLTVLVSAACALVGLYAVAGVAALAWAVAVVVGGP